MYLFFQDDAELVANIEKDVEKLLKDKDRITYDALLEGNHIICPHRYTYKQHLYDLDRPSRRNTRV